MTPEQEAAARDIHRGSGLTPEQEKAIYEGVGGRPEMEHAEVPEGANLDPGSKDRPSGWQRFGNAFKGGLAHSFESLTEAAKVVADPAGTMVRAINRSGATGADLKAQADYQQKNDLGARATEAGKEALGVKEMPKPDGFIEQAIDTTGGAMGDLTSYAGIGKTAGAVIGKGIGVAASKVPGVRALLGGPLTNKPLEILGDMVGKSWNVGMGGAGAAAGQEAASQVSDAAGLSKDSMVRELGQVAGGAAGGAVAAAPSAVAGAGATKVAGMMNAETAQGLKEHALRNASAGADRLRMGIVHDMLDADPEFAMKMAQYGVDSSTLNAAAAKAGREGDHGLAVGSLDNGQLTQLVEALMRRNPKFKAQYDLQVGRSKKAADDLHEQHYGNPVAAEEKLRTTPEGLSGQLESEASKAHKDFDEQSTKLADDFMNARRPAHEIGADIERIHAERENEASRSAGAGIQKVVDAADAAGIKPDPTYVKHMVDRVREFANDDDFMNAMPAPVRRMIGKAGEKHEDSLIVGTDGKPIGPGETKLSMSDLDQMDRALAKRIRDSSSMAGDKAPLRQLKNAKIALDHVIQSTGEDVHGAYREAKAAYKDLAADPYNVAGLDALKKSRFDATRAKRLVDNPEVTGPFLSIAGKEGPQLVKQSLITDMLASGVVEGNGINAQKLSAWRNRRRDVLAHVPEFEQQLHSAKEATEAILAGRAHTDKVLGDSLAEKVFSAQGKSGENTGRALLDNADTAKKFMQSYADSPEAVHAGRSMVVREIRAHADQLKAVEDHPAWVNALDVLGGRGWAADMKEMGRLQRVIKVSEGHATPDSKLHHGGGDAAERAVGPGFTIPWVAGIIRNQVMSTESKLGRLGSKAYFSRQEKVLQERIESMLLHPEELHAVVQEALKMRSDGSTTAQFMDNIRKNKVIKSHLDDMRAGLVRHAARAGYISLQHPRSQDPEDQRTQFMKDYRDAWADE